MYILSPSPHLFPGHASHCQRSDRLIHAVFTVPKRFPSGLSPSAFPPLLFSLLRGCILIIRCVYITSLRGDNRGAEAIRGWHWTADTATDKHRIKYLLLFFPHLIPHLRPEASNGRFIMLQLSVGPISTQSYMTHWEKLPSTYPPLWCLMLGNTSLLPSY